MNNLFTESTFFGAALSLIAYGTGIWIRKRFNKSFLNPLLISLIIVISFLAASNIDYETYNRGAKHLTYLLTPATVALAVPLYENLSLLKKHYKALFAGIICGVVTSLSSILAMSLIFGLSHEEYVTILPKSITTAIGIGICEELGGITAVCTASIIITGVLGNIMASALCRLLKIKEPVAKGVAMGTSAHAMGVSRAMELGKTEGAMGSLSIVVAGLLTVIGASIFSRFM